MRLKVMTYNVLFGFHERIDKTLVYQEQRAHAVRAVVRAEAPDVVALTEGAYCGYGGRVVRHDFAAMFDLPHVACVGFEGEWTNVLASRFPILHAERLPLGSNSSGIRTSALRATLDCEGREVNIDIVHPSPRVAEAERLEAFAPLLATVRPPYILLGDFNALSDEDDYTAATLRAQMLDHVDEPEAIVAHMLDRKLIAGVRATGLVDTLAPQHRTHTIPTRLARGHATQGARIRIDYIFVSQDVRVVHAEVVQRPPTDEASDHYPVVATLELGAP
ncbi:MAG: endonuclease/exonuclease/phosphatase family protein [Nannocystis sp.]|nr:endonuclease/exonuclease/phosphatase family protein [Nannocystis sp.]MBA3546428.1 endonuclease/exonuclease/phosphatase family protein [Nannocystis sp.]